MLLLLLPLMFCLSIFVKHFVSSALKDVIIIIISIIITIIIICNCIDIIIGMHKKHISSSDLLLIKVSFLCLAL